MVSILSQQGSIIDITDYHNLYLLITTEKNIYIDMPPNKTSETTSKIINITAAATYNTNYILLACTGDYLLSKINIYTGEEISLVNYSNLNLSIENLNYTCSISILNNNVYIGINQILDNYLKYNVIKINLTKKNENNEAILDGQIILYNINLNLTNFENLIYPRLLSCEIISRINNLENPRLVCGYFTYNISNNKYIYYASILNENFTGFLNVKQIEISSTLSALRLQKINSTFVRYLMQKKSFEIYLDNYYNIKIVGNAKRNKFLYSFTSAANTFYYHNQYIFSANPSGKTIFYLFMKSNISESYIRFTERKKIINNCMGYYDEINDKLEIIYQYANIIKYFLVKNINSLFHFQCKTKIIETLSNESIFFNVSELITYPLEHKKLYNAALVKYLSTSKQDYSHTNCKIKFNESSQILSGSTNLNNWMTFYFFFYGGNLEDISNIYFIIPTCLVNIRVCAFKCGSCSQDYYKCDPDTCKMNFTMLRNSNDTDCYPNDQNIPNYIYNKTTEYYEECYSSCKFCSKQKTLSSNLNHNCLTCNDGYLKSYEYMGNCYLIDNLNNNSETKKIVNNQLDKKYTIRDFCHNKYIIASTGECVSECPIKTVFHTFKYLYINFTEQKTSPLKKMFPLTIENIPKFKFGNLCYEKCPNFTSIDNNTNLCKCKFGWQQNSTTKEIICYDNKEYCLYRDYFYHEDTKECVLYGCRDEYYQFNFECYKNNCPNNTEQISSASNKCETILNYCYIDKYFKTHCSNQIFNEYKLRYKDTKIYFKSCNESLYFFGKKTYLYQNICYDICPEATINNDIDDKCECKYYKMYLNDEKTEYECLKESEKCEDKNKISIKDINICIDNLQKCLNENHKIFNNECYHECPENTEQIIDNISICICKHYYYLNQNNLLICFSSNEICDINDYPLKKYNSRECFKTNEECIQRGFYIFNNLCYNNCPINTEDKNNDNICLCSYNYFNNSNLLTCFNEEDNCTSKGYSYINMETKECFNTKGECIEKGYAYINIEIKECFYTKEECIEKGFKIFNNECYDECPLNSEDKNNNSICECTYHFYKNNGILQCLNKNEIYENESDIKNNDNKEYVKELNDLKNIECPNDYPFYNLKDHSCIETCNSLDFFNSICKIINNNIENKDKMIKNLQNDLSNGNILSIINEEKQDLMIKEDHTVYVLTTSENEKNNKNDNVSTILLGECENKLREYYNMSDNDPLFIFKIEDYEEGLLIPIIEYEVYNLKEKGKLDMNICKDIKIDILIPATINENNLFMYNSSHEYYNDICYPYTTENGTDIILKDRRNEYINNNMSLCESNCEYKNYDNITKKVLCNCKIKENLSIASELTNKKNKLFNSFKNIKTILNIEIIKCYRLVFNIISLKANIGNYIILFIIILCIILLYIFICKGYNNLIQKIVRIIEEDKLSNKNTDKIDIKNIQIIKMENNIISNQEDKKVQNNIFQITNNPLKKKKKKKKKFKKKKKKEKLYINISSNDINSKNYLDSNKQKKNNNIPLINDDSIKNKSNKKFNDYEMNSLNYKKALKYDKRTYCQYYLSLLRTKHLLIFTFYTYDDYNSKIIKIILFLFSFSLYYTVNALFFTDSTMHKIYEDKGSFNFLYQIPKILYSSIICSLINIIVKILSISERNIIFLKKEKDKKEKAPKIIKCLIIKYIFFFILTFLFLLMFWYYLSCFCAIYKNTQIHLIKDTIISFTFSLLYPFGINLIPGIFRIQSLNSSNKDKECLYIISKYIQLI